MRLLGALAAALGVFFLVAGAGRITLVERLRPYLRPDSLQRPSPATAQGAPSRAARAGLPWSDRELHLRQTGAAAIGAIVGALAAQSDLFLAGPGRSVPAVALLGAATGALVFAMWLDTRAERRTRRLRFELPVVADAVALRILAGDTVLAAIRDVVAESSGVAAEELAVVVRVHDEGSSLPEALERASRITAEPEAARLYGLLGHAHVTGGRLVDALSELSKDYRAGLARDVGSESGRRALTSYGPVLLLMVPIAMLFLLYPTLVGLRNLAAGS